MDSKEKPHVVSTHHKTANLSWYDKWYKILLIIPCVLLLISLIYLGYFYSKNGDIILRDTSLAGGTTITLPGNVSATLIIDSLEQEFADISVRSITNIQTGEPVAIIVETSAHPEVIKPAIERVLGYTLNSDAATIEFTGATLSKTFYKQLMLALVFSFVLICAVIFFLFRTFIPSAAVIFAIFADIVMPLALIDFLGIKLSAAGIAAFLMLIGYSVDTDILLTTRVLRKKEGSVNQRIYGAFKTGIFMNITALLAVLPAFFIVTGLPDSFRQIFFILALGLCADALNTWLTNASIIKWYADKKGLG